jgi:hypothetical protein
VLSASGGFWQLSKWSGDRWTAAVSVVFGIAGVTFGLIAWLKPRRSKVYCWCKDSTILTLPDLYGVSLSIRHHPVQQLVVTEYFYRNTGPHRIDASAEESDTRVTVGPSTAVAEVSVRGRETTRIGAVSFVPDSFDIVARIAPIDPGETVVLSIAHDGHRESFSFNPSVFAGVGQVQMTEIPLMVSPATELLTGTASVIAVSLALGAIFGRASFQWALTQIILSLAILVYLSYVGMRTGLLPDMSRVRIFRRGRSR